HLDQPPAAPRARGRGATHHLQIRRAGRGPDSALMRCAKDEAPRAAGPGGALGLQAFGLARSYVGFSGCSSLAGLSGFVPKSAPRSSARLQPVDSLAQSAKAGAPIDTNSAAAAANIRTLDMMLKTPQFRFP